MRAIERWCIEKPFVRRFKVWTHLRYDVGTSPNEIWWHVELTEYLREFIDHGQAKKAMAWSHRDVVYVGYGPTLAVAAKNALRRARKGEPKEYWGGVC